MKRVILFVGGFGLAFCSSVAMQFAGGRPEALWGLFILVGCAVALVPKASSLPLKLAMLAAYASVFAVLWMISNPEQASSRFDEKVRLLALTLIEIGTVLSLALLAVAYAKLRSEQPLIRWWAILVVLAGLIAYFSSPHGGAGFMTEYLVRHFGLARDSANAIVLVLRKTIHFGFYGTLALSAWKFAQTGGSNKRAAVTFAILFALFHASFDELRQASEPNRTGSFWDVCLDLTGAAAFLGVGTRTKGRPEGSQSAR